MNLNNLTTTIPKSDHPEIITSIRYIKSCFIYVHILFPQFTNINPNIDCQQYQRVYRATNEADLFRLAAGGASMCDITFQEYTHFSRMSTLIRQCHLPWIRYFHIILYGIFVISWYSRVQIYPKPTVFNIISIHVFHLYLNVLISYSYSSLVNHREKIFLGIN